MNDYVSSAYEFMSNPEPGTDSPLNRAGLDLDKAVAELEEMVALLSKRLHPVLRPSEPTPDVPVNKLAEIRGASSPHIDGLHDLADKVHRIRSRVGDLSSRLDL